MRRYLLGVALLAALFVAVPAHAAIVASNIYTNNFGAVNSATTSNLSPTANSWILVVVGNRLAAGATAPETPTGCSLTFVQMQTGTVGSHRITTFRSLSATPGSGCALTVGFSAVTQDSVEIIVNEYSGTDTSGTNGSGAVVQASATDDEGAASVNTSSVALAAFGDAVNNAPIGCWYRGSSGAATAGAGFTIHGDTAGSRRMTCEDKIGEDTTVDISWATSTTGVGLAIELKAASTQSQAPRSMHQYRLRR